MLDILDIQRKIGYTFKNYELLFTTFTHSSYANENGVSSYERLEFLGDSILGYVVAKQLYAQFPDCNEGFLTKTRAKIVSAKALCQITEGLDIIKYMQAAGGAIGAEVRLSSSVKSDLFEAIVGAIMLDSGDVAASEKFILDKLQPLLNKVYTEDNITDFKSKIIELCAQQKKAHEFICEEKETDGKKSFFVTLTIDGKVCGEGEGQSKLKAEQLSAKIALSLFK